jgi:hypothetical protein
MGGDTVQNSMGFLKFLAKDTEEALEIRASNLHLVRSQEADRKLHSINVHKLQYADYLLKNFAMCVRRL